MTLPVQTKDELGDLYYNHEEIGRILKIKQLSMKKGCILATALFLISTIVFVASAQNVATAGKTQNLTGKELLGKITSPKPGDRDYALGFVTGVYCVSSGQGTVPDIASSEKIVQIVKKYLETHKDVLDRPASDLVISALKQHPPGK